jgi:hypothetical protein
VAAGGDPGGKRFQFAKVVDGGDTAQVEPGVTGELLDAGWKISGQWSVVSGQPAISWQAVSETTSSTKGYHFTAGRVQLTHSLMAAEHWHVISVTVPRHKAK